MSGSCGKCALQAQWSAVFEPLRAAYEAGDATRYGEALDAISGVRERELWQQLNHLESRLRGALEGFQLDPRLLSLAGTEIPNARERLDRVMQLTEEAANRTLDLVERSAPVVARIASQAGVLKQECRQLSAQAPAALGQLLGKVENYLDSTQRDGEGVQKSLHEVLMTQGFQDLSGQIIRRVIDLVNLLETELARIVHPSAHSATDDGARPLIEENVMRGVGPAVPGVSVGTVDGQQGVDELLAMAGAS